MNINRNIITAYNELLVGNTKYIDSTLFAGNSDQIARELVRFAFRTYLYDWTPHDINTYLTWNLIEKLKLSAILRYIEYPKGVHKNDLWYISTIVNAKEYTAEDKAYQEWLNRKIAIEQDFERGFYDEKEKKLRDTKNLKPLIFDGQKGRLHICNALQYCLPRMFSFVKLEDVFQEFSQKKIKQKLKSFGLEQWSEFFRTPLHFLWFSLNPGDCDAELFLKFLPKEEKKLECVMMKKGEHNVQFPYTDLRLEQFDDALNVYISLSNYENKLKDSLVEDSPITEITVIRKGFKHVRGVKTSKQQLTKDKKEIIFILQLDREQEYVVPF